MTGRQVKTTTTEPDEVKEDQWPNSLKTRYITDPKNLTAERPALKNDRVSVREELAKYSNSQSVEEEGQVRVELASPCTFDVFVDP